jgi:molybdenum cofactor cytidylyltransferase
MNESVTNGVVILAAGRSSRMGKPKLLLPWGATSILGHLLQITKYLEPAQTVVVYSRQAAGIESELDRLGFPAADRIFNPLAEQGMFSSIQSAARWSGWHPAVSHWVFVLADQPHLSPDTWISLREFQTSHAGAICQPAFQGRARHPVIIPRRFFAALRDAAAPNLNEFLRAHADARVRCELADPALATDIDYPADYERAWAEFSPRTNAWAVTVLVLALGIGAGAGSNAIGQTAQPATKSALARAATNGVPVELEGKVVCLAEVMHQLYGIELPTNHEHLVGFSASDGRYYSLLRSKYSEALFADSELQKKVLKLKGRLLPGTQLLDVQRIRSLKAGVEHDLYYYCDICAIQMVAPGPCLCCRDPVYLVEKPLTGEIE